MRAGGSPVSSGQGTSCIQGQQVTSFPVAAAKNHHELGGLKQHKCAPLTALEAGSLKPRCHRARAPSGVSFGGSFLPVPVFGGPELVKTSLQPLPHHHMAIFSVFLPKDLEPPPLISRLGTNYIPKNLFPNEVRLTGCRWTCIFWGHCAPCHRDNGAVAGDSLEQQECRGTAVSRGCGGSWHHLSSPGPPGMEPQLGAPEPHLGGPSCGKRVLQGPAVPKHFITTRDLGRSQPKSPRLKKSEVLASRTGSGGSLVPSVPLLASSPRHRLGTC